MKRYLVEFGTGVDVHGGNVTKAAKKALRDAISHCCMTGLTEVVGLDKIGEQLHLKVKIATPYKEKLDVKEALTGLPAYKHIDVEVVDGGLEVDGMFIKELDHEGTGIVIVNAAITVCLDI